MESFLGRLTTVLLLVPLLSCSWLIADAQVDLPEARDLAVASAGVPIRSEAALRAGLAGPGPLTIAVSIMLTSPLPTINKYILIQGDSASCRAQATGWCTLSTRYRFRHFVVANGGHLVLLNLRLKAGRSGNSGGSILVASGSRLAVEKVFFQYNYAAGKLYGGGAVEVTGQSTFAAKNSLFLRNVASFGGAVDVAAGSSAAISNSLFHNNSAALAGGAMSLLVGATATLVGNEFTRNQATIGGAIYADQSSVVVCNITEFRNVATLQGPSIFSAGGANVSLCGVAASVVTATGGARVVDTCAAC